MTEIEKRICELRQKATMLEFGTYEQWRKAQPIWDEIKKISHGRKGWVVSVKRKDEGFDENEWYLTDDSISCLCESPTYFESEEEAKEYIERAGLDEGKYSTEIKWMEGRR